MSTRQVDADAGAPRAIPTPNLLASLALAAVVLVAGIGVTWSQTDRDARPQDPRDGSDSSQPGQRDAFDRVDATGLEGDQAASWREVAGRWGVEGGTARVVEAPDGLPRAIALVDMGRPDGTVRATAAEIANGWGLVFRYRGTSNYWMLTAAPDFATFNVRKVVDGEDVPMESIGIVGVTDGVEVSVTLRGDTFEVHIDDELAATYEDEHLVGATLVGIVADGLVAQDARWDDFSAVPALSGGGAMAPSTTLPPPVASAR